MNDHPIIIITGSSGLVGSALVSYFAKQGFHVRALQRTPLRRAIELVAYFPFDLADVQDRGFAGADYLIHCAYRSVISEEEKSSGINIDKQGATKVIALSRRYGIKVVFLSSTSAHPHASSYYAKNKLFLESLFDNHKDLILKLGLVLGGNGGLFGKIKSSLRRYRILPLIGGGQQRVQTVALDDVCRIVEEGIRKDLSGIFRIAHPSIVTMKELYRGIAHTTGARPFFVAIPLSIAYLLTRLIEKVGFPLLFTSENILGLKDLKTFNTAPDLAVFGVQIKDWQTTLE